MIKPLPPRKAEAESNNAMPLKDESLMDDNEIISKNSKLNAHSSTSGVNVAYILGNSNAQVATPREVGPKKNLSAKIDQVRDVLRNENRVDAGHHDLEMRQANPTNTQCLMDERYATSYQKSASIPFYSGDRPANAIGIGDVAYDKGRHVYDETFAGGTSKIKETGVFDPVLSSATLLQTDTMSTWAPLRDGFDYDYKDGIAKNMNLKEGFGTSYKSGVGYDERWMEGHDPKHVMIDRKTGKIVDNMVHHTYGTHEDPRVAATEEDYHGPGYRKPPIISDLQRSANIEASQHWVGPNVQGTGRGAAGSPRKGEPTQGIPLWPLRLKEFSGEQERRNRAATGL
jgi:hypothetical protein